MRAISIIYKRELGTYLRSPIGWVIAAVILLANGILFQAWALSGEQLSAMVLERFFYTASGLSVIAGVVLSFRLIAEERQNHSMVLLTTSPIKDRDIVVGKFLAAWTFLVIIHALSVYMPLLIKVHGKIAMSQIFVGYVGLCLNGAAAIAIGMFASSLTKSQLVAALIAAFLAFAMSFLFPLARRLEPPVRDVLENTDLWWIHFQNGFMRGVLNLKDVVYYLAMTYFFLLLGTKTLETKRWQ
jgi:ABC-2 type transport system permease protein